MLKISPKYFSEKNSLNNLNINRYFSTWLKKNISVAKYHGHVFDIADSNCQKRGHDVSQQKYFF